MLTLNERLQEARRFAKKTQLEAAKAIGKSRARYAQFEGAKGEPSLAEINLLASCFKVSAIWLTHKAGPMTLKPTRQSKNEVEAPVLTNASLSAPREIVDTSLQNLVQQTRVLGRRNELGDRVLKIANTQLVLTKEDELLEIAGDDAVTVTESRADEIWEAQQ